MSIKLSQAVDMVVRGIEPSEDTQSVKVDDHNFYIRPHGNKNLLVRGETSYFRHQHIGKDDRVFYSVKVKGKNSYDAKITRIEYRGPFNKGGLKFFGVDVVGALGETGPKGAIASKVLKFLTDLNLQSKVDGDWELAAAKIVDAIGAKMAEDGN